MNWSAIISVLLELFGPLLMEFLKQWLDDLFKRASLTLMDPAAYDAPNNPPVNGTDALYEAAIRLHESDRKKLWWFQFFAKWKHDRRTELLLKQKPVALRAMAERRQALTVSEQESLAPLAAAAA